jgi:hypothetical protein
MNKLEYIRSHGWEDGLDTVFMKFCELSIGNRCYETNSIEDAHKIQINIIEKCPPIKYYDYYVF